MITHCHKSGAAISVCILQSVCNLHHAPPESPTRPLGPPDSFVCMCNSNFKRWINELLRPFSWSWISFDWLMESVSISTSEGVHVKQTTSLLISFSHNKRCYWLNIFKQWSCNTQYDMFSTCLTQHLFKLQILIVFLNVIVFSPPRI